MDTALIMFTVYNPWTLDFPGQWVVRRFRVSAGRFVPEAEAWHVGPSLEGARASIPQGYVQLCRDADDDPVIHEIWV